MSEELIVRALEETYQNTAIHWQVVRQESILHLYANYETDCPLDYDELIDSITKTLADLDDSWQGFWLYSRVLGEVEPDWQTFIDLETDYFIEDSNGSIEEAEDSITEIKEVREEIEEDSFAVAPELEAEEIIESDRDPFVIESEEDKIEQELSQENREEIEVIESDSDPFVIESEEDRLKEELPQENREEIEVIESDSDPFVIESEEDNLKEELPHNAQEKISINLGKKEVRENQPNNLPENKQLDLSEQNRIESQSQKSLAKYCFIRNKRLLNSKLVEPSLKIANIVKSFNELTLSEREDTAKLLYEFFYLGNSVELENYTSDIKVWWQQIEDLNETEKRKASIWLSRYCFEPELTKEQIKLVFDAKVAKQVAQREIASSDRNSPANTPDNSNNKYPNSQSYDLHNPAENNITNNRHNEQRKTRRSATPSSTRINILIPIFWLLGTILFIVLGVNSANSENLGDLSPTPVICETITDSYSLDYCKLAVDFIGEDLLDKYYQESSSFSFYQEEEAIANCEVYANLRAGVTLDRATSTSVIDSYGESILPGIFVAEAEQHNFKTEKSRENPTIRIACVYNIHHNKAFDRKQIQLISTDLIPNDWPAEAYEGKTLIRDMQSINKALGIYGIFILMGAGTLFTAIGLFVASMFNLGITIYSLDALYRSAFILGIVETIFSSAKIPMLQHYFIILALKTLALGITGACVKDLTVHWSRGYRAVALGTATILFIRYFLQYLLIVMITAFIV